MTALAKNFNRPRRGVVTCIGPIDVENAVVVYEGAIVHLKASEFTKGTTATGEKGVGIAKFYISNTPDGQKMVIECGIFEFANATAGDAVALADIGKLAYTVDDNTVSDVSTGRSPCGTIWDYDAARNKVWVKMDPSAGQHGAT